MSSHVVSVDKAAFATVNVAASAAAVAVGGRAGNDFAATLVAAADVLAHLIAYAAVVFFLFHHFKTMKQETRCEDAVVIYYQYADGYIEAIRNHDTVRQNRGGHQFRWARVT